MGCLSTTLSQQNQSQSAGISIGIGCSVQDTLTTRSVRYLVTTRRKDTNGGAMKMRSGWGFWKGFGCIIGFITLVGCAGTGAPRENLRFSASMQPKFMQGFPGNGYELTRFVLRGDSINEWTEALETFNAQRRNFPATIDAYLKQSMDLRRKTCPDSLFNVIKQDQNSILFEIRTTNCPPNPDEHSLTRTLYGNTNVFSLIYTNKVKELPPDKREEWIKYLSDASIVTK